MKKSKILGIVILTLVFSILIGALVVKVGLVKALFAVLSAIVLTVMVVLGIALLIDDINF